MPQGALTSTSPLPTGIARAVGSFTGTPGGSYVMPDRGPFTRAGQAVPIPIAYGACSLPFLLIEKQAPNQTQLPLWLPSTNYYFGQRISVGFLFAYECSKSGVSASSGTGPSGVGIGIVDGTCAWDFRANDSPDNLPWFQIFVAALCEGEIKGINWVLVDRKMVGDLDVSHSLIYPCLGMKCVLGPDASGQVLTEGAHGFDASGYQHTACVYSCISEGVFSGTQQEIPAYLAQIRGVEFDSTAAYCNPGDIINDLITHTRRGCGHPSGYVDSGVTGSAVDSYHTYCDAAGFRFGFAIEGKRRVLAIIADLLAASNSQAYWSQGKVKIVPLDDTAITSPVYGSTNYTPVTTPAYALGPNDFLDRNQPVQIQRRPESDCFNTFSVEYYLYQYGFAKIGIEDPDQVDIDRRGVWRGSNICLPVGFANQQPPLRLSRIFAQASLNTRNTYSFRVGWKYCLLEPTDILTLTDSVTGLDAVRVKIETVEEGEDGLRITARDWPAGVYSAVPYTPPSTSGYLSRENKSSATIWTLGDGTRNMDQLVDGSTFRKTAGINTSHLATATSLAAAAVTTPAIASQAVGVYQSLPCATVNTINTNPCFVQRSRG